MGGGSVVRQYENRFHKGERIWYGEKGEVCTFDQKPELVKAFGEYGVYRAKGGGYELIRSGVVVGSFAEARIEEGRVIFPLSYDWQLEVSQNRVREIITPEKATLCGLIGSDGGNHFYYYYSPSAGHMASFYETDFTSMDEKLIQLFDNLFQEIYRVTPRHGQCGHCVRSKVRNKYIFYNLNNLGAKTGAYRFHVPREHLDEEGMRAYLEGFFSGDGTLYRTKSGFVFQIYSKYEECLEEVRQAFINLGFHPNEINTNIRERERRGRIVEEQQARFSIPTEEHERFIEEIGSYRPGHLIRFKDVLKRKT